MSKSRQSKPDLRDSENDRKHLEPEKTILDLPDVKDIPGQENIKPPRFAEMEDTTASSADEEGDGLFQDEDADEDLAGGANARDASEVTPLEKRLLRNSARRTPGDEEETDTRRASLDRSDEDGDPLNESSLDDDRFGEDLDLPESEEVDQEDSSD